MRITSIIIMLYFLAGYFEGLYLHKPVGLGECILTAFFTMLGGASVFDMIRMRARTGSWDWFDATD